jgi:phosphoglycolate phosphatase-like HAD superfamily hydrolase
VFLVDRGRRPARQRRRTFSAGCRDVPGRRNSHFLNGTVLCQLRFVEAKYNENRNGGPDGRIGKRIVLTIGKTIDRLCSAQLSPKVVIFDVEGTLVDAVLPTLRCWTETLGRFGFTFNTADLHAFSGMTGAEMLEQIIPQGELRDLRARISADQGRCYREQFIDTVQPIPGTHELIVEIKRLGIRVAAVSSCQRDELVHYCKLMKVERLFDALACGTDVAKQKVRFDLIDLALKRLRIRDRSRTIMIADTPFDAIAARRGDVAPLGVLTGYFSASELQSAGCSVVFRKARDLLEILNRSEMTVRAGPIRSNAAHAF